MTTLRLREFALLNALPAGSDRVFAASPGPFHSRARWRRVRPRGRCPNARTDMAAPARAGARGARRPRHLSLGERFRLMAAGRRLMRLWKRDRDRLRHMTVAEVMDELAQSDRVRQCFWYPLALATLNEDPQIASAGLLAAVLERAFFARRIDSAFVYSKVGLSDLYCEAASSIIERAGGVVACRSIVEAIDFDDEQAVAVRLRDGARLQAANFVIAIPPDHLLRLLPEGAFRRSFFRAARDVEQLADNLRPCMVRSRSNRICLRRLYWLANPMALQ